MNKEKYVVQFRNKDSTYWIDYLDSYETIIDAINLVKLEKIETPKTTFRILRIKTETIIMKVIK